MLEPYSFFFELPLYAKIEISSENVESFWNLMHHVPKVDGFNPNINENTTYSIDRSRLSGKNTNYNNYLGQHVFTLRCLRTAFEMIFYSKFFGVIRDDGSTDFFIMKIGQFPSIADIHLKKFRDYNNVIEKKYLKEISRAIGLAANGVGIGSYVYLRRVFEFLIEEAHLIAKNDEDWDESIYQKSKVIERIELLKHHLPEFLVNNKSMYSILSLGLHQLNEQECLTHFEALKVGIELILDEKVELLNKRKKIADAQLKIQRIKQELKAK